MSVEYYSKLARIVAKLRDRTLDGETVWERTARVGTFLTSFADYSAVVVEVINPDTEDYEYTFQIRNSSGDVVETVTDDSLTKEYPLSNHAIRNLHRLARRSALGADEAVDKMLQYLEA